MVAEMLQLHVSLAHQNAKEEKMKTRLLASLALGLALASPAAVYASDHPVKLHHRHHIAHRQAVERNPAVDSRAVAYAHLGPLSLFGQGTVLFSVQENGTHETDGLSRNPDDCVRYGCIDNN